MLSAEQNDSQSEEINAFLGVYSQHRELKGVFPLLVMGGAGVNGLTFK